MNAPAYQLNSNDAREGSGGGGGRIDTTGPYIGTITKAKHIIAGTGAIGIEFEFESQAGQSARFTLYTLNKDGQPIYGGKQLQALMAVLKLRSLTAKQATIEEYSFDTQQKEKVQAEIYPDLMGKTVGIVFQMEEYLNSNQDLKSRPNFFAPFDATTKQVAAEVLDQSKAEKLDKMLATLKDKKLPAQQAAPAAQSVPIGADAFDDDIPF